jgi:hypothetical protein
MITTAAGPVRETSQVLVRTWTGETVLGTVTATDDDIKNGRAGIDYVTSKDDEAWVYGDQIVRVVTF